jgi:predicted NBD/HSP70 family sugar kinase
MSLFGIDLGGTKIEGAIIDPQRPDRAQHRLRVPTEGARGYAHVVAQVAKVIARLEAESGLRRPALIGIGTPGTVDPATGIMKNSNTLCLNGRPLAADLSRALGTEVRLANDANCFALAEATLGAARGHGVVMGLILGTGVGGGVVVNGQVLGGLHGIAGEWGHNPLRGERTPCYCGRKGCIETVLAGPSLERFYRERTGTALRLPEIAARAEAGEAPARATLARLRDKFGEAIAAVINVLDPDSVVIGGGVGNLGLLYGGPTRAAVLRYVFNADLRTQFLRPALGDSAGVFGAAMLTAPAASTGAGKRAGSPRARRIR